MATSFRIPPDQMKKLEQLANALEISKAQVVKDAIDMLYESKMKQSKKSKWDALVEGGFEPISMDLGFEASDIDAQRRIIHERVSKKHNRRF
ncbi:MAG: ribbon-helix-helix domain-containing protein [Candidatus Obscuribacterales bacterium]|nr:ribbon-helix-helix domain-containing protein [Candidatus Obscuribacterales bacterium]